MTKLLRKFCFIGLFALGLSIANAESAWLKDIDAGVKKAKAEDKLVLVEFTGSDWCGPCIMIDKQVLSKEEFLKEVQKNYVLVKLDSPNSDEKLQKSTGKVMEKWGVNGFPTFLLLDAKGEEVTRFNPIENPTVDGLIERLVKEMKRKDML